MEDEVNYLDDLAIRIRAKTDDRERYEGDMALYRLYAVLALAKGKSVTAKDVHDAWAAWACEYRPGHRCLVPFDELATDIQSLDGPFVEAIQAAANGG